MGTDTERPNLLYIHSDQHNPAVIGCYGDPLVQTPNLDSLAAKGVLFTNVYCPSPVCVPSRMSMLAGRYPSEIEVWTNNHILDSGVPTFAHAMGAADYHPVLIGRMHGLGPDQLHGYAERLVGDHGGNYPGSGEAPKNMRASLQQSGSGQSSYQVHDEDVTASTVNYLDRFGVQKRAGLSAEPFCLSVGFMLPHSPYVARREDYELYRDVMTLPKHHEPYSDALHPYFKWWREWGNLIDVPEAEILSARTAYWALVTRMDIMIGEILKALRKNDLAENTLIIYSSDHGDQMGEHGLWMKRTFYEASVKVPAILSWPEALPEGVRCDRVLSSLDLNATMLEALGAPPLPNARGRSVLDLVRQPDTEWEDLAFSEYCTYEDCLHRMIRRDEWKLNYYHGQEPQLFNLAEDPDELSDRAQDASCREIREQLTTEVLEGWDPEAVADKMEQKRADLEIIRAWAEHTKPKDQFRWERRPEMDYLD